MTFSFARDKLISRKTVGTFTPTNHTFNVPFMFVRAFLPKDRERVREICLMTSPYKKHPTERNKNAVCALYNDYYTECEPDNCFVAVDDADTPVGYIVCSTSPDDYLMAMKNRYILIAQNNRIAASVEQAFTEFLLKKYRAQGYTAHLHINLADEGRHQGLGTRLMAALVRRFQSKNVKGVMLICSSKNVNACRFYERCGFKLLKKFFCSCVYGASPDEIAANVAKNSR